MNRTKAKPLEGLEQGVLPLSPMDKTFHITRQGREQTVSCCQLPLTPAYAFADYRSQGQTNSHVLIDIGTPPTGELTPCNVYVALSRSHGREGIRLLGDFDEKVFTTHPNEHLRVEDERLIELDKGTRRMD
ncbi:hypothetical protein HYDPIDRAFT_95276 [Hydnomerulius pinastri MD-312]|uniref:Unplaced genomic scaffold scaffold_24, whole genome shotgun sequence n=1 Tax=Hydnomerulius pinastri MD-312 TaxID=994086 RepID=A0A0C9V8F2_9AGAM|nr:hypothetical protein HYDPIDRAFT_95276 [Hydnomerulius pinastri MD-312]